MDWIELRSIELFCIIGMLERERHEPQQLLLEVGVGLDLDSAAGGDLRRSIDYQALLGEVRFLAEEGAWRLVESLAVVILRNILLARGGGDGAGAVQHARVAVQKPLALRGVAVPRIQMERTAGWFHPRTEAVAPGVELTLLLETPEARAYSVLLAPDATWSPIGPMSCLVTEGTLAFGDRSLRQGERERVLGCLAAGPEPARALLVERTGE